jgi:ABC-type Zn uptake system ZnuABC Zn-binding protein ZnuA
MMASSDISIRPCRPVRAVLLCCLIAAASACGQHASASSASTSATTAAAAASRVAAFSCPADGAPSGAIASAASRRPVGDRLQVVTTVAPITSIVANIAGDRADVHGVIPEGVNSHTYEPKPNVAQLMSTADIVFVNGLKLEDPTRDIAEQNIGKGAAIIELGTMTIAPDEYIYDFSFPRDAGKPNPHLWTDPPMAKCYAAIASRSLQHADPANATYYAANYSRYAAAIDALDRSMQAATKSIPAAQRQLLTYHDAYAYFAVHYGYRVVGAVQVSDFEDPTPKEVASLITQIKAEKVPAVFGSEVFPSPVLAQIAEESGTKYVDTLRDDDLPGAPGDVHHSYLGLMKSDFVTIVSSLGGDASGLRDFDDRDVVADGAVYPQ